MSSCFLYSVSEKQCNALPVKLTPRKARIGDVRTTTEHYVHTKLHNLSTPIRISIETIFMSFLIKAVHSSHNPQLHPVMRTRNPRISEISKRGGGG